MTSRERFLACITGEKIDRLPLGMKRTESDLAMAKRKGFGISPY